MGSSPSRLGIAFSIAIASLLLGCMSELTEEPVVLVDIDESTVLAQAAAYRDSSQFMHMSSSYPSAVASSSYIQLYASRTASTQYAAIDPGARGSNAIIPVGGIIVREVLDQTGTSQRLTIMAKGPAGYNPTIGDWFWAVTDLNGTPIVEQGVPRAGRLADCYGCHQPYASDDYLFGVPLVDRGTGSGSDSGSGMPPGGTHAVCGDFVCEGEETQQTCSQDCNHGHTK